MTAKDTSGSVCILHCDRQDAVRFAWLARYLCICCACSAAAFARCCSCLCACWTSTAAACLAADRTSPAFGPPPKGAARASKPVVARAPERFWLARLFDKTSGTRSSPLCVTATAATDCSTCVGARTTRLTFGARGSRAEDSTAESGGTTCSYSPSSCRQRLRCGLTSVDTGIACCCWDACQSAVGNTVLLQNQKAIVRKHGIQSSTSLMKTSLYMVVGSIVVDMHGPCYSCSTGPGEACLQLSKTLDAENAGPFHETMWTPQMVRRYTPNDHMHTDSLNASCQCC